MKKIFPFLFLLINYNVIAQDINLLLKEADNFEHQFKEEEALNKYKQVLTVDGNNVKALVKAAELSCTTGERLINKNDKRIYFESALAFAQRAVASDSNNADAYCAKAAACAKMTKIETDNKKMIAFVRDIKINADKALQINPNHAKANFIEGKWHYEMVTLNWAKRLAVKAMYGGLPEADMDKAILYLEKSRSIDPYYVLNGLTLAKAYKDNNRPAQTIEVLKRVVKMPTRTFDDTALKEEAQKMLQDLE